MLKPNDPSDLRFSKSGTPPVPVEFHVLREARKDYQFEQDLFASRMEAIQFNYRAVHDLASRMNRKRNLNAHPELVVRPGALFAVGLIHQILSYVMDSYWRTTNPGLYARMTDWMEKEFPTQPVDRCIKFYIDVFPTLAVYRGEEDTDRHLTGSTQGKPNPFISLEQMILVFLANENRAAKNLVELFDDTDLERSILLRERMESLEKFFQTQPAFGPYGQSLLDLIKAPFLAAPDSLEGQLGYIKDHWISLINPAFLTRILSALDLIQEDQKAGWLGAGPAVVPEFKFGQYGAGEYAEYYAEPERFSFDKDWMPSVVVMAKSVHVWLDQLSRSYSREIRKLDQIPDEELDKLARWGFTGLWLIGLWERSPASQTIKRMSGNQDALSSAYSLYDYEIAADLGGQAALDNLQHRTQQRGIRLASDMVPNHMGLYSKWVVEHPDWFMQLPYPPYPNYTYSGANLSWDDRVGIRIEDGYWDHRDAAVTFQRVDHWTGETRYIYHGNDGTSMPWNDTAQLNFLLPEVREAVIQLILHVARSFPIIRFDAAMTLTKKHYQRLWFPKPGEGGAIPSRSEYGMTRAEFDHYFPTEFWREVVDRIAAEVPDTLLIAEAFWLTEGFFVRTLGMHRVYNSAFMNMLKMEDNAAYRNVIKNILEFDPRIIQRFVNFMNNPDEDTAVAQFGKGDKYFGVAMMMATMPGLPMFGHGQIEGLTEKYGMEFSRAQWNETPDEDLIRRHEYEIFPLMRRRRLFSGAENFVLYDFYMENGSVNEDVFAYSNRREHERALIVYHNKYNETKGWVKNSAAISVDNGAGGRSLIHKTLAEGLDIDGSEGMFTIYRDLKSGLEYIRRSQQIVEQGFFVALQAYQYFVLTDFREVHDDIEGRYTQLCNKLDGAGVPSIDEAYREIRYEPVMKAYEDFVNEQSLRELFDEKDILTAANAFAQKSKIFLEQAVVFCHGKESIESVAEEIELLTTTCLMLREILSFKKIRQTKETQAAYDAVISMLPEEPDKSLSFWRVIFGWISVNYIGQLKASDHPQHDSRAWFEEWLLTKKLAQTFHCLGADEMTAWREVEVIKILISHNALEESLAGAKKHARIAELFEDPAVQSYVHANTYQGIRYFHKESLNNSCSGWY